MSLKDSGEDPQEENLIEVKTNDNEDSITTITTGTASVSVFDDDLIKAENNLRLSVFYPATFLEKKNAASELMMDDKQRPDDMINETIKYLANSEEAFKE